MTKFLDSTMMREFSADVFTERLPFPWFNFSQILTPEGFDTLYQHFPPLELFEAHVGLERPGGQRPHDRYYLAYEHSIYNQFNHNQSIHNQSNAVKSKKSAQGEARHDDLPAPWQAFLEELKASAEYHGFIERLLGAAPLTARYAWHVGTAGSEVSPHRDADNKIGTHIFYFNTQDDWDPAWQGSTLVLGGRKGNALNPDFSDFAAETAADIRDNHSFLFKNTADAWHGVRTLTCPDGRYRRLFNVIFQTPDGGETGQSPRGLGAKLRQALSRGKG